MKPKREETVIVIDRHAQATEFTGWRRWLAAGVGYLVVALVALVGVALLLGLAMTFAMVMMVAIPLALVLALIGYATGHLKFDVRRNRF
jgi:peptidoglycan/LPS O-acetylase OafA/YrhL